jgi:hypothetical protein
MGEEFDVLGRVEVGAKVEVGEIDGTEQGVVGDDRVEEDVDGHHPQCREHGGLRPSCSSAGGRGGGERRGTTFPSPWGCNTWRGRGRGGRGRESGKSRRA